MVTGDGCCARPERVAGRPLVALLALHGPRTHSALPHTDKLAGKTMTDKGVSPDIGALVLSKRRATPPGLTGAAQLLPARPTQILREEAQPVDCPRAAGDPPVHRSSPALPPASHKFVMGKLQTDGRERRKKRRSGQERHRLVNKHTSWECVSRRRARLASSSVCSISFCRRSRSLLATVAT